MRIGLQLSTLVLAVIFLSGCKSDQFDKLLGRDRSKNSSAGNNVPQQPALSNTCLASANGHLVDINVPASLDLSQAVITAVSLSESQLCAETASVNANGQFVLQQLAATEGISTVNVTVTLNGASLSFSRDYNPNASPSALADINLS